ncbi:hypothetical protein VM1G_11885 [Cytospora mali]|uniref:Uncharacterized protein n=1 Tax=Cytospora mali TaxID=578113 RepID=A0A194WBM2_CYTMA|nr:hypothetical protein VM1G_11885 [Valsa mali]
MVSTVSRGSGSVIATSTSSAAASTGALTGALNDTSNDTSNGASNGVNVNSLYFGLGVGIPVAVLAVGACLFAWHIRRTKERTRRISHGESETEYRKPELHADSVSIPVELDTCKLEMSAEILGAELPGEGIMAELPGESVTFDSAEHT